MASRDSRPTKSFVTRESKFQKKALEELERLGYYAVKVITCNRTGWMDVSACAPDGKFVGIELKRVGKGGSDMQLLHIREVKKRGGYAFVAATLEELREGLEKGYRDDGSDDVAEPLL